MKILPALMLSLCACVPPQVPIEEAAEELTSRDGAPDRYTLSVCWETKGNPFEGIIREAVQTGWEREGNLAFTGWKLCSQGGGRVHLRWWDGDTSHTSYPTPFRSYFTIDFEKSTNATRVRHSALHEFGHVLGFEHEQNRDDNDGCANQGQGASFPLSPIDPFSVMHYCDRDRTDVLSGWDVEGLQKFYGDKPRKTLISSIGGRCAEVPGNSSVSGTGLKEAVCSGSNAQLWDIFMFGDQIRRRANSSLCLASDQGSVLQSTCDSTAPGQKWKPFDNNTERSVRAELVGPGGYCLTLGAAHSEGPGGNYLELRPCGRGSQQDFFWDEPTQSLYTPDGRCVDIQFGSTAPNTPMWTWSCNGSAAQMFRFDGDWRMISPVGACMRVENNAPFDGAKVVAGPCDGTNNEAWRPDLGMQIRGVGGKCLATRFPTTSSLTPVELAYCDSSTKERWVYAGGKIISLGGRCLTALSNGASEARPCEFQNTAQKWSLADNGEIRSRLFTGKCLDVAYGDPNAGTPVGIFACNGTDAQKWSLSGRIRQNDLCLEGNWTSGMPLSVRTCMNIPQQIFDYHF